MKMSLETLLIFRIVFILVLTVLMFTSLYNTFIGAFAFLTGHAWVLINTLMFWDVTLDTMIEIDDFLVCNYKPYLIESE